MSWDPNSLRLGNRFSLADLKPSKRVPKPNGRELFLRGPIPLAWLSRAAGLRGKALATGLALWFLAGVRKTRTVPLTHAALERFGVHRKSSYGHLKSLQSAGLVTVQRRARRSSLVTILEVSTEGKSKR